MGETPLHKACNIGNAHGAKFKSQVSSGYVNVVKSLISRGARTDLLAENQSSCYDVAKTNGHTEVMSLLGLKIPRNFTEILQNSPKKNLTQ